MGGYRASFRHLGLMVSDLALINLSYLFTFTLRLGRDIPWSNLHDFVRVAPWLSVMAALVFYLFGLYSDWIDRNPAQIIYAIAFSLILLNLLAMGLIYLTQSFAVPRSVSLLTPLVEMLVLTLTRLSIWSLYRRHFFTRRVLVVGEDAEESKAVAKKFLSYANGRFSLVGLAHGLGDKEIEDIEAEIGQLGGDVDIVAVSSGIAAQGRLVDYCIRERKEMLIVPDVLAVLLQSSDARFMDDKWVAVSADGGSLSQGSTGLIPNDRVMASTNPWEIATIWGRGFWYDSVSKA
ncbi:hypothetical protein CEB3_c09780 [Peptococcaceae bacterium CEB3]|nr:hypothetical protein CEB3_c09780 [Peptococcaceae bacterium CEB3]